LPQKAQTQAFANRSEALKMQIVLLATALSLMACQHGPHLPLTAPTETGPYVVKGSDAPTHSVAGGKVLAQLFLNQTNASNLAALSVLTLQPGAAVPLHSHPESAEILYMLEGKMDMTINGTAISASAGDAIHIPLGAEHSAKVASDTPVKAVQVYVAPGPEQRFTKAPIIQPSQPDQGE
jgi:quercetin dioxygenase-like cupin family protein